MYWVFIFYHRFLNPEQLDQVVWYVYPDPIQNLAYAAGPGNPNCWKRPDGTWVWHEVGKPGCGYSKISCQAARQNCINAYKKSTPTVKTPDTKPIIRSRFNYPFPELPKGKSLIDKGIEQLTAPKTTPTTRPTGDGKQQGNPACDVDCGNLFLDPGCYLTKMAAGCPGSTTGADVLGGGKEEEKAAICNKDCGMDPACHSAKLQYNCGGCWFGLPNFGMGEPGCFIVPGAIVGAILLIMLVGRR
jgi:hypothetical protein